jgi:23S rRNA (adenine-N6)-dimethyltransferase
VAGARLRWGWRRLDSRWIGRLIDATGIGPGDLVLDIGAGDGRITAQLLDRGVSVIAVELHPDRAAALRDRFRARDVTVVRADASDLRPPRQPFKVVANPPFGITTALLRRLTRPTSRLETASLVVPAWAAARWSAGRGAGGTASKQLFRCTHGGIVPAKAFRPAPRADAGILRIQRSGAPQAR